MSSLIKTPQSLGLRLLPRRRRVGPRGPLLRGRPAGVRLYVFVRAPRGRPQSQRPQRDVPLPLPARVQRAGVGVPRWGGPEWYESLKTQCVYVL